MAARLCITKLWHPRLYIFLTMATCLYITELWQHACILLNYGSMPEYYLTLAARLYITELWQQGCILLNYASTAVYY